MSRSRRTCRRLNARSYCRNSSRHNSAILYCKLNSQSDSKTLLLLKLIPIPDGKRAVQYISRSERLFTYCLCYLNSQRPHIHRHTHAMPKHRQRTSRAARSSLLGIRLRSPHWRSLPRPLILPFAKKGYRFLADLFRKFATHLCEISIKNEKIHL